LRSKGISVTDYVLTQCINVLALIEMRLGTATGKLTFIELVPTGLEFSHIPHKSGRRGDGIGILYKSRLVVR